MIQIVTKDNAVEFGPQKFVIDASDLQIPVGQIPYSLLTDLGNKHPFIRGDVFADGSVAYNQMLGCITLIVLND